MKRIASFQFDNVTQYQVPLPPGWYRGIMLSVEGTNESGQTMTRANLGDIRLIRDGKRIWEITLEKLYYFVQQAFPGSQQFSSTISSTVNVSIYIPFHFLDQNVVRLGGNYVLEFSHADISAVLATTTMTVLQQSGLGQEKYFPLYNNFSIRPLSALTEPERFNRKNLSHVIVDFSANNTHFRLKKGENYLYDCSDEELDFSTALETPVDSYAANSATVPHFLGLYKDRVLAAVAGANDVAFGVVNTTDAAITGMTVELELNPAKMALSNEIVNNVARKAASNDGELTNILAA